VGQKAPYPSHFGLQILSRSIEQKLSWPRKTKFLR